MPKTRPREGVRGTVFIVFYVIIVLYYVMAVLALARLFDLNAMASGHFWARPADLLTYLFTYLLT